MTHKPTDETRAQVEALATFGVPQVEMAKYLGIKDDTLRKYYAEEIAKTAAAKNIQVMTFLYHGASGAAMADGASYGDCARLAMFWAKTRMNWRETNNVEHSSPDGSMRPTIITLAAASDVASND